MDEFFPGVFHNPLNGNPKNPADNSYTVTFAESTIFIPKPRYIRRNNSCLPWQGPSYNYWGQLVGCHDLVENRPPAWDLFNQNWTAKLVPANSDSVLAILRQHPGGSLSRFQPPQFSGPGGSIDMDDIRRISFH